MSNKKGSSLVFSIITMLIIIVGLIALYFGVSARMKEAVKPKNNKVDNILAVDLETDYPNSPASVVRHYYEIYSVIYSGDAIAKTSELVWQQRGLFSEELNLLNPFELQKDNVLSEIAKTQAGGNKLLTYEITDVYPDIEDEEIFYVETVEYWTGASKVIKTYALILDGDEWKIHRWDILEENKNGNE